MTDEPVTTTTSVLTPVRVAAVARRARGSRLARFTAPLLTLVAVLGCWLFVSYEVLDPARRFLLPPPQDVLLHGLLSTGSLGELLPALWSTTQVALVGLAISIALGIALGIVMSQARWLEYSLYPYAIVLQTIPILAIVPLLGFWFGFDFTSRVIVCVLVSLFPIITNTLFGLTSVDTGHHELFSLHGATRGQRLLRLQLPAALPAILTGCKISAGLSVIGAIIADYFFRQGDPGIGRLIDIYRQRLQTEGLLSALVLSSLVGLVLFWSFDLLDRRVRRRRTAHST
jgi:NitT/TauT family transport system permease protein